MIQVIDSKSIEQDQILVRSTTSNPEVCGGLTCSTNSW